MVAANKHSANSVATLVAWHITTAVGRQPARWESPASVVGRYFRDGRIKKPAGQLADHGCFVPKNNRKPASRPQVTQARWSGVRWHRFRQRNCGKRCKSSSWSPGWSIRGCRPTRERCGWGALKPMPIKCVWILVSMSRIQRTKPDRISVLEGVAC